MLSPEEKEDRVWVAMLPTVPQQLPKMSISMRKAWEEIRNLKAFLRTYPDKDLCIKYKGLIRDWESLTQKPTIAIRRIK